MSKIFVEKTIRDVDCDNDSPITHLVLDQSFKGINTFTNKELKATADADRLFVKTHFYCTGVKVRIFINRYERYVATTNADDTVCNNLLSLPIFYKTPLGTTPKDCSLRY